MKQWSGVLRNTGMAIIIALLAGCDDPQIYGSIGVSSGYSNYGHSHGRWGSGMHTSISVGGRIR